MTLSNRDSAPLATPPTADTGPDFRPHRAPQLALAPLRPPRRNSKRALVLRRARERFAAVGFAGTHVADVAAAAGIGKSTFFHYFADKHDLYRAAVLPFLDGIAEGLEHVTAGDGGFEERLALAMQSLHHHLALEEALPRLLLRELVDEPVDAALGAPAALADPAAAAPAASLPPWTRVLPRARIIACLRALLQDGLHARAIAVAGGDVEQTAAAVLALACQLHPSYALPSTTTPASREQQQQAPPVAGGRRDGSAAYAAVARFLGLRTAAPLS